MKQHRAQASTEQLPVDYADIDLERILIGAILSDDPRGAEALRSLEKADLTTPRDAIFEVCREHSNVGWPVEMLAVAGSMRARGWQRIEFELATCFDDFINFIHGEHLGFYVRRLRLLACMRILQSVLGSGWTELRDPSLDIDERLQAVAEKVPPALADALKAQAALGGERGQ